MKKNHSYYIIVPIFAAMLLLILDSKTAIYAVSDGIDICLKTVIPSLFPFLFLSALLTSALYGHNSMLLRPLASRLGFPHGCEGLLVIGALGGYPIGAKCISLAYESGVLPRKTATRIIGFCNNAGPAFIFGMLARAFATPDIPWILWLIHLISAFLVGIALPKIDFATDGKISPKGISITAAVEQSIKTMGTICGWIILFKILINFLERWFLWLLPTELKILLIGILEVSNGCIYLNQITDPGLRFILCSAMIGFGGICVNFQTATIARKVYTRMYLFCKILQSSISVFISTIVQWFLFAVERKMDYFVTLLVICAVQIIFSLLFLRKKQNNSGNMKVVHV